MLLEDEVDAKSVFLFHAAQRGQDVIFFAHAFLRPFDRDSVIAGVSFYPGFVIVRALAENLLAHHRNAENLTEEIDHLLGPREIAQVAVDHDAVETVVYKNEKIAE